jgi:hypothetical protein
VLPKKTIPYPSVGGEPIDIVPAKTHWVHRLHRVRRGASWHRNEAEESFIAMRTGGREYGIKVYCRFSSN